jgi:hypothetical protein
MAEGSKLVSVAAYEVGELVSAKWQNIARYAEALAEEDLTGLRPHEEEEYSLESLPDLIVETMERIKELTFLYG